MSAPGANFRLDVGVLVPGRPHQQQAEVEGEQR